MLTLFAILFSWVSPAAEANVPAGRLGLGVIVGEPTAISVAYTVAPTRYFSGGLGYRLGEAFSLHLDHIWIVPSLTSGLRDWPKELQCTIGVGGVFGAVKKGDAYLGARLPLGLQWYFKSRFQTFLELVPTFSLSPATHLDVMGGLGLRYFF